jgi:hypothetical protein
MVPTRPSALRAFCQLIAPVQEIDLETMVVGDLTAELALATAIAARTSRTAVMRFT